MNYRQSFAACLRKQGRRPRTIQKHCHAVKEFSAFCLNKGKSIRLLKSINSQLLQEYFEHLVKVRGLLKRLSLRIGATVKVCDLRLARFIGITNEANTDEISAAA